MFNVHIFTMNALLAIVFSLFVVTINAQQPTPEPSLSSAPPSTPFTTPNSNCGPLSICYAVDESGSIDSAEYTSQVNALVNLTTQFDILAPGSSFAASAFSYRVQTISNLTSNVVSFISTLETHNRLSGGTNIPLGLSACGPLLTTGDSTVPAARVIVLVTDGNGGNPVPVAESFKNQGIYIITIGVSTGVNDGQLRQVASVPSAYTPIGSFSAFSSMLDTVLKDLCSVPVPTTVSPSVSPTISSSASAGSATGGVVESPDVLEPEQSITVSPSESPSTSTFDTTPEPSVSPVLTSLSPGTTSIISTSATPSVTTSIFSSISPTASVFQSVDFASPLPSFAPFGQPRVTVEAQLPELTDTNLDIRRSSDNLGITLEYFVWIALQAEGGSAALRTITSVFDYTPFRSNETIDENELSTRLDTTRRGIQEFEDVSVKQQRSIEGCPVNFCATRVEVWSMDRARWRVINRAITQLRRRDGFRNYYARDRSLYLVNRINRSNRWSIVIPYRNRFANNRD